MAEKPSSRDTVRARLLGYHYDEIVPIGKIVGLNVNRYRRELSMSQDDLVAARIMKADALTRLVLQSKQEQAWQDYVEQKKKELKLPAVELPAAR